LICSLNIETDITELSGKIVSSFDLTVTNQESRSKNILQNGLGYKNYTEFIIPANFKSGIYLINNKYPLIVKSKEKAAITVVFPFMNNILFQSVNYENVFSNNTPTASFNRTCPIDPYTKGMANFFSYLNTTYQVNYITDIDIENPTNYNLSKLILIYGKSTCWTPKMANSLKKFQRKGGNTLSITSYCANNICWDKKENEITLIDSSNTIASWYSYDSLMPLAITGTEYGQIETTSNKYYTIQTPIHQIFNNINQTTIKLESRKFSLTPVFWNKKKAFIDLLKLKFYSGEILAYSKNTSMENESIKGIFIFRPSKQSGTIITLGSEDWCLKKNIGEKEQLQIITKNATDYLIKE
jgi:hypothetical protein